jgi:hypothetical protein
MKAHNATEIFGTADGNYFFKEHDAKNHNGTLNEPGETETCKVEKFVADETAQPVEADKVVANAPAKPAAKAPVKPAAKAPAKPAAKAPAKPAAKAPAAPAATEPAAPAADSTKTEDQK